MTIKNYKITFAGIFILNFLFFLSHTTINMLPPYLKELGASNGYIGLYMNMTSLGLMLYVIVFGKRAALILRKPALIASHLLFAMSMGFSFVFHENLAVLFVLRIISSISYFFGYTINFNVIYDILPYEKRVRGVAFFGVSGILSNPLGAYIGEWIIKSNSGYYLFSAAMFAAVIAVLWICLIPVPENIHRNSLTDDFISIIKRKELRLNLFISIVFGGAFGLLVSFLPNFTMLKLDKANLSYFFTTFAVIAVLFRIFLYKILEVISFKNLMIFSLSSILISFINLIYLRFDYQLILTGILYGMGHSILFPVLSTHFVNSGQEHEKVTLTNTFVAVNVAGTVLFSYLFGAISDFTGLKTVYVVFSFIIVITIFLTAGSRKR